MALHPVRVSTKVYQLIKARAEAEGCSVHIATDAMVLGDVKPSAADAEMVPGFTPDIVKALQAEADRRKISYEDIKAKTVPAALARWKSLNKYSADIKEIK